MGTLHIWIFAFASWDGLVTRTVQAQEKITLFLLKLHPVVSGWSVGGRICWRPLRGWVGGGWWVDQTRTDRIHLRRTAQLPPAVIWHAVQDRPPTLLCIEAII